MSDTPPTPPQSVPAANPDFWAEQVRDFMSDLQALDEALLVVTTRLSRAVQQAADLGLMREQHDLAGLRTAVSNDIKLNQERDIRQEQADGAIAALRLELRALALRVDTIERVIGSVARVMDQSTYQARAEASREEITRLLRSLAGEAPADEERDHGHDEMGRPT